MRVRSDQDSNPFARSTLIIKDLRMKPTFRITFSHNIFKAGQGCSRLFKNVRAQSILLNLQRELGC
jgi:hypothetical protein